MGRAARILISGLPMLALVVGLMGEGLRAATGEVAAADYPIPTTACGGTVTFHDVPTGWFLTVWPGGDPALLYTGGFDLIELEPGTYGYEWHGAQDLSDLARIDIHLASGSFTIGECSTPVPTPAPESVVLIGAADICRGGEEKANAYAPAALIVDRPDAVVFTAGDNSNETGSEADYEECVAPTWGVFRDRTFPAPGNHDYETTGAEPYYDFYPQAAGPSGLGWYSYDLPNAWHVIVLNAICDAVGGCGTGSPQETWLRSDLAANKGKQFIAIWHIPAFSSGSVHGNSSDYLAWWQDLYAAHARIVINGHDHDYERSAPQSPTGVSDPNGIREFVVGTGGVHLAPLGTVRPNSQVRNSETHGVLELTLRADGYQWQFIPGHGAAKVVVPLSANVPSATPSGPLAPPDSCLRRVLHRDPVDLDVLGARRLARTSVGVALLLQDDVLERSGKGGGAALVGPDRTGHVVDVGAHDVVGALEAKGVPLAQVD